MSGLHAASITAMEASFVAQGTIPDNDLFLLTSFTSFQAGQILSYSSSSDTQHWTAILSGAYLSNSLDVNYSGDLSGYPGAPVTWTSMGSFGASTWTGTGMMTITDEPGGFTVILHSALQVGTHTGTFDDVIWVWLLWNDAPNVRK